MSASRRAWPRPLAAMWFDLDGTLVDSAPDLYRACVELCAEHGTEPPNYAAFRPLVSRGGMAMLRASFGEAGEQQLESLLPRFLEIYAERLDGMTRVFDGMRELLDALTARRVAWGVVTNKSGFLAEPLLQRLGLHAQAAACIYGDTLERRKPDPAPLLHACHLAGFAPGDCIYVGDDERDIQAGHAAGMYSIAAAWGYLDGGDPHSWGADRVVTDVAQLARLLADEAG